MLNKKKILLLFLITLSFLPILIFRDYTPDNELKYISIVMEAFKNKNFITFTNHGIPYSDKPPLYFWIIMLVKKLTGSYSMLGIGLFSFLPALIIVTIMWKWTKDFLSEKEQLIGGLMLLTTGLFAGGAIILRMDLLMCLFITLALYEFYNIYTGNGSNKNIYFFFLYIFLGLFTKGPMGILTPILSIIVFLIREKELKNLKKFFPLKGLSILLGGCLIWFLMIYFEGGKEYLYDLTVRQTVGRSVNSFAHNRPFYYYMKNIWLTLLPWSFLYIFSFFICLFKKLEKTKIQRFFSSIIIINFIFLSVVSGKLEVYLLPIYPFITFYTLLFIRGFKKSKLLITTLILPSLMMLGVFPGYMTIKMLDLFPLPNNNFVSLGFFIVSMFGTFSLIGLFTRRFNKSIWSIGIAFLLLIFSASFEIGEINNYIGLKNIASKAKKIHSLNNSSGYYSYNFRYAPNMNFYLKKNVVNYRKASDLKKIPSNSILFIRIKDTKRKNDFQKVKNEFKEVGKSKKQKIYIKK